MPPSITQSQLLPILGAIVAFLFAALLVLYIFRLLFGRRIKAPGPRNRARRLDIIDTFDLDRERQLVIIRRDNTEHLLMIGGPNDVLIEPSINRVEGRDARPIALREAAREKEGAAAAQGWPAAPGPEPAREGPIHFPSQPSPSPVPGTSPTSEQARRKPLEAGPPSGPQGLPPLPPDLFAPAPPKPAPPEAPSRPAPRFTPPPSQPRTGGPGFTPPRPAPARPSPPPFFPRAQRPAGTPTGAPPPAPSPPQEAPPPPREAPPAPAEKSPAPPPPEAAPTPKPPATETVDPLESLEAEMARLLGRPDSKP